MARRRSVVGEPAAREHDATICAAPRFRPRRVDSTAPRTFSFTSSRRVAGAEVRRSTPRSAAERNRRATSARPLRNCMPRPWIARSMRCLPTRLATCAKARGERVTFMNAAGRVLPGWSAHERRLAQRLAQPRDELAERTRIIRRRDDRSAARACTRERSVGVGNLVPLSNCSAVCVSKNATMRGAASRKASTALRRSASQARAAGIRAAARGPRRCPRAGRADCTAPISTLPTMPSCRRTPAPSRRRRRAARERRGHCGREAGRAGADDEEVALGHLVQVGVPGNRHYDDDAASSAPTSLQHVPGLAA